MSPTIKILYFASARDATDVAEEEVTLSNNVQSESTVSSITLGRLLAIAVEQHPALAKCLQTAVIAVNMEYIDKDEHRVLVAGDEVAIIPPVSGG
ncbi:hypothetical protein BDF19DRAFT_425295 [Syncephalis fuscata]|nr:hypothetical protein BDF19DRAFT_425295 [Syncephalis fuscata]